MKPHSECAPDDEREPQPGDLLLFCNARQWNKLITWFTRSPYYHVAIYRGDGFVVEARPRGVVERDLNGPDGDKSFDVIASPHGREIGGAALHWAQSKVGAPYDKVDVAVIVLERLSKRWRFNYTNRNRFSCAELVACAWEQAGAPLFPGRKPEEIVPADFAGFLSRKTVRQRRKE